MRRVVIRKYGGYERLELERFEPSPCGPHEVQIQVAAAGINYADCTVRMGLYKSAKEFVGLPITPGFEVAGTVIGVGTEVSRCEVGDVVIAATFFGGYAECVLVEETYVFPKPANFSMIQAAGSLATYLTAYYALFELAHPRAGGHILIHSAAGGVGTMLVQLAHTKGLTVTGVVGSAHKVPFLTAFKPAHIIDKSTEDLWKMARRIAPDGYDVICDANGVATLAQSYKNLRRPGKLIVFGFASMLPKSRGRPNWLKLTRDYLRTPRFNPLDLTTESRSILAFNLSYLFDRIEILTDAMQVFDDLVSSERLAAPICTTYSVEAVAQAHKAIETGQTTGKLILTF